MKNIKIFTLLLAILLVNSIHAQPVTLDPTFGQNGMTVIPNTSEIRLIEFDNSGNIIAAGYTLNEGKYYLTIVKTNENGIIDQNFGTDGIVTGTECNAGAVLGLKITNENKIFITGSFYVNEYDSYKRTFMQFNENGTLDETFGENGKIVTDFGTGTYCINLESDDFILFGAVDYDSGLPLILKCNYYGVLDRTFGDNGRAYLMDGEEYRIVPKSIKILNDQSILIAGRNYYDGLELTFCKIDANNGNFVTDFADNGIRRGALDPTWYPATTINTSIIDVIEDYNGNLTLLATVYEMLPTLQMSIACRFLPNGDMDSSDFGIRGYYYYLWPYSDYFPEKPQKILQNGSNYIIGSYDKIRSLNHSGILDLDFNHTGIYDCENFVFLDMKLQKTNKLILGGVFNGNLAIIRLAIPYKVSIKETHYPENRINIFPNPTTDYLYFSNEAKFEMMDIQGRVLIKSEKPLQSVNVSHLKAGVYFIRFEGDRVGKFVKM